jgi:hypothetical protein
MTGLTDSPDPDQIRRYRTGMAGLDNSFFAAFAKCEPVTKVMRCRGFNASELLTYDIDLS